MSRNELLAFQKTLIELLDKGFIRVNYSPVTVLVLFAKKPEGGLCYEHAHDQWTLGSVTGYRHSRTTGRIHGSLIGRDWPCNRSGDRWSDLSKVT
jgi:hypothetical protein